MKLYWNANWQLPGKQDGRAVRRDIPSNPELLAAWLNERNVMPDPWTPQFAGEAETQLASDGDRPWVAGPPTKDPPRVAPADFRLADGKTDFIPVTRAAQLDLHFQRCPSCHRDAAAALQAEHVIAWVRGSASLDDLQLAAEAIRSQVSELGEQLGDRSVQ